jgi:CDP-paratose 2-epimerase
MSRLNTPEKSLFGQPRSGRSVLITGGTGFIGTNLADRALAGGDCVTILDDLSRRGADDNVRWLRSRHGNGWELIVGSVVDPGVCARAVANAEVIYHLAAQTAVTTSVGDPRRDFEVNATGTFNLLEAARCAGHGPVFLYASTNKVYGGMANVPTVELPTRHAYRDLPNGVDESCPLDFHSPYGCSKGAADQYVRDYARIYGLPTIVFRQSCIYGPRQMGVEDQGWVAWFVIALIMGRPITIFGDGKQTRDLLYVDDLLRAFDLSIDRIETTRGQIYNMGGGPANAISIWWEFKRIAEEVLGRTVPEPAFVPARTGDQPVFVADTAKARHDFGWAPTVSAPEGIQRLAAWVTEHRALFA